MLKPKNGRTMLSSKYVGCGRKRSRLMKKQEEKGILGSLDNKTPLSKIRLFGDILF